MALAIDTEMNDTAPDTCCAIPYAALAIVLQKIFSRMAMP